MSSFSQDQQVTPEEIENATVTQTPTPKPSDVSLSESVVRIHPPIDNKTEKSPSENPKNPQVKNPDNDKTR